MTTYSYLQIALYLAVLILLAKPLGLDRGARTTLFLCVGLGNTSFLGFPLCSALLGDAGQLRHAPHVHQHRLEPRAPGLRLRHEIGAARKYGDVPGAQDLGRTHAEMFVLHGVDSVAVARHRHLQLIAGHIQAHAKPRPCGREVLQALLVQRIIAMADQRERQLMAAAADFLDELSELLARLLPGFPG